jgi:tetratricopeptide (TPR) repeat protein
MQFELKLLSREAIPDALEKAMRYRLLNEPSQAESICLDVLRIAPGNQAALTTLLLALTDQFGTDVTVSQAKDVLESLDGEYERAYYAGIISERSARARICGGHPGAAFKAYEELTEAMRWYEKAQASRATGNDDSILRWNTCARTLMQHSDLRPRPEESLEPVLDD